MASEYAFERNPGSVLFAAPTRTGEVSRSVLVVKDPSLTKQKLKKDFGHRIPELFEACLNFARPSRSTATNNNVPLRTRSAYQASSITTQEAVDIIDLANDLCHTVALHLLKHHSRPRNVNSGQGLSHCRGHESHCRRGLPTCIAPQAPQPDEKGVWGETHVV